MTTTSQKAVLSLLDKAEQTLDAVYIQAKEAIKAQKELISQDIERMKKDEEMDDEEKKSLNNLYLEDYKYLMKSIQDLTQSIEKGKGEMENRRRERESYELCQAVRNNNNTVKVMLLLKRGIANIDWKNPIIADWTPLIFASRYNCLDICKILVEGGAKLDVQSREGDTALIMACYIGHQEIASFLLAEGAAYTFKNNAGFTAGDYAVEEHGWNWNYMIAEANLSFFDHVFDCMVNADHSPLVEKKKERKRKRGEEEEEEKKEELPFLLRFMKRVYFSDLMMSKYVFPKLSFNPGAEAGEGKFSNVDKVNEVDSDDREEPEEEE